MDYEILVNLANMPVEAAVLRARGMLARKEYDQAHALVKETWLAAILKPTPV